METLIPSAIYVCKFLLAIFSVDLKEFWVWCYSNFAFIPGLLIVHHSCGFLRGESYRK